MLNILSKIFGPHRAVSIYVFLQNRGLMILVALVFLGGVAALLLLNAPRDHEHVAFVTLPVISSNIPGGQIKNGVIASVRLPDGTAVSIDTSDGTIAKTVTDTACVEQRRFVGTDEYRYRFKLPHNCAGG